MVDQLDSRFAMGWQDSLLAIAKKEPTLENMKRLRLASSSLVPDSRLVAAQWRYTTTAPKESWFREEFDDTLWPTGQGGFGSNGVDYHNVGKRWDTKEIWLRRHFVINRPVKLASLTMAYDDGAVAYLNGVKICRGTSHTDYRQFPIPNAEDLLRVGENVLAIHCKNSGGFNGYVDAGVNIPHDETRWRLLYQSINNAPPIGEIEASIKAEPEDESKGKLNLRFRFSIPGLE